MQNAQYIGLWKCLTYFNMRQWECICCRVPELILVYLYDLPLQFQGLFREKFEVPDIVGRVFVWVVIP